MVELSCGNTCMKYILFVINFLFFLLGAAAFGLGIWALVDKNKMNVLTKVGAENTDFNVVGLLESAAIVLLVGGAAILIIGFLGCCGAMKQSQCLLCLYSVLLMLILIIQLAAIVIAAVFNNQIPLVNMVFIYLTKITPAQVQDKLKDFLKENINSTYEGEIGTSEEFSLGLDYAQVYFQCCGVDSYTDFQGATQWNKTTSSGAIMTIPPTCCKMTDVDAYLKDQKATLTDDDCPVNPTRTNSNMMEPCWSSIEDYLKSRITLVIGIAAGILALEVFCVIFACCIISALRKGDK